MKHFRFMVPGFLVMTVILCAVLIADTIYGKMAARQSLPIEKVFSVFREVEGTRKLSDDELAILTLAKIDKELGITSFEIEGQRSEKLSLQQLSVWSFRTPLLEEIQKHPQWENVVPPKAIADISAHREILEKALGSKTYPWAWFLYQMKEKEAAKKILSDLYEEGFQGVMKLSENQHWPGESPLDAVEYELQALEPMSTPSERAKLQSKMQEMKTHVSNLREVRIMT